MQRLIAETMQVSRSNLSAQLRSNTLNSQSMICPDKDARLLAEIKLI